MLERIHAWRERTWVWFQAHAEGPFALPWLAAVSFADAIFFPIAPEVFLVALVLAHPRRWRRYLLVALTSSVLGAMVGYWVARMLFAQFGMPVLEFYHLESAFISAQHFMRGHVFFTMALGNFSPVPDKALIYAAGFLSAHFVPFITGYALGRAARMCVVVLLAERYGSRTLALIERYFVPLSLGVLALIVLVLLRVFG